MTEMIMLLVMIQSIYFFSLSIWLIFIIHNNNNNGNEAVIDLFSHFDINVDSYYMLMMIALLLLSLSLVIWSLYNFHIFCWCFSVCLFVWRPSLIIYHHCNYCFSSWKKISCSLKLIFFANFFSSGNTV